jgi:hypothetical protein
MAMRTLKNMGKPLLPCDGRASLPRRVQEDRETRGPEAAPSLERDANPHGRLRGERGKTFDDGMVR